MARVDDSFEPARCALDELAERAQDLAADLDRYPHVAASADANSIAKFRRLAEAARRMTSGLLGVAMTGGGRSWD